MCKVTVAVTQLSPAERKSVLQIGTGSGTGPVPFKHSLQLISLGLAELSCGRPELTLAGKKAVRILGGVAGQGAWASARS